MKKQIMYSVVTMVISAQAAFANTETFQWTTESQTRQIVTLSEVTNSSQIQWRRHVT